MVSDDDPPPDKGKQKIEIITHMIDRDLLGRPQRELPGKAEWVLLDSASAELTRPAEPEASGASRRGFERIDFQQLGSIVGGEVVRRSAWPEGEIERRLSALIETKASLRPRLPMMRFTDQDGVLAGPFIMAGERGRAYEEQLEQINEEGRHREAAEVAKELAETSADEEVRRDAKVMLALVEQAQVLRDEQKDRAECVARIERLLGSLFVKLLRPGAEQTKRLHKRLHAGGNEENQRRAEAAARRKAAEIELIHKHLRERPGAANTTIARWITQSGQASLGLSGLRQLVGRVRRGLTPQS